MVNQGFLLRLVLSACLSSLLFGLILAATNTCQDFVSVSFETCGRTAEGLYKIGCAKETLLQQITNAATMLGAGAGSFMGGSIADKVGRRGAMFW